MIDFEMEKVKNGNFNSEIWAVRLKKVYFYTNAENFLEENGADGTCPQGVKEKFLENIEMVVVE